jgi:hypothetical protein
LRPGNLVGFPEDFPELFLEFQHIA